MRKINSSPLLRPSDPSTITVKGNIIILLSKGYDPLKLISDLPLQLPLKEQFNSCAQPLF